MRSFLFPLLISCLNVQGQSQADSIDFYIDKLGARSATVTIHRVPGVWMDTASKWLSKCPDKSIDRRLLKQLNNKNRVLASHIILTVRNFGYRVIYGESMIRDGYETIGLKIMYNNFEWSWYLKTDEIIIAENEIECIKGYWNHKLYD